MAGPMKGNSPRSSSLLMIWSWTGEGRASSSLTARGRSLTFLSTPPLFSGPSCFEFSEVYTLTGLRVAFGFRQPFPPVRLTHLLQRRNHPGVIFVVDEQGRRPASLRNHDRIPRILHALNDFLGLTLEVRDRNDCFHEGIYRLIYIDKSIAKWMDILGGRRQGTRSPLPTPATSSWPSSRRCCRTPAWRCAGR